MLHFCSNWLMKILGPNMGRLMNMKKSSLITYLSIKNCHSLSPNSKAVVSNSNAIRDFESCPPMPFDICPGGNVSSSSKNVLSKEKTKQGSDIAIKKGMVLLKEFFNQDEQASIVMECRNLGVGPGGFYGQNKRRMMMCLGLDWDPISHKYSKRRQFDNILAPNIPHKFHAMVTRAMIAAQDLTETEFSSSNVERVLPMMSPDTCIVQFYTTHGKLGYHQDRDESRGSLAKGLPIVSISVGDSAVFLYGDSRDISKANRVILESGDVLIFGGPSRHIFHAVKSVISGSAPKSLLEQTGLLNGRLNLTFRQF